jgi:hypothetical protein
VAVVFMTMGGVMAVVVMAVRSRRSVTMVVMTPCGRRSMPVVVVTVAVIVVRLVLVAHSNSVPQPLSAVFAAKSV